MNTDWLQTLGYAAHDMPLPAIFGRLLVAALCGGVVGFERELHDKPLGLRTHVLVALGACGFIVVTLGVATDLGDEPAVRIDPGRARRGHHRRHRFLGRRRHHPRRRQDRGYHYGGGDLGDGCHRRRGRVRLL